VVNTRDRWHDACSEALRAVNLLTETFYFALKGEWFG
jgi:hypothetical protein